jgi:hypothetical protein
MNVEEQIKDYIDNQPEPKRGEMHEFHRVIFKGLPGYNQFFNLKL